MGGFFFDFEAIRTASRPRRSSAVRLETPSPRRARDARERRRDAPRRRRPRSRRARGTTFLGRLHKAGIFHKAEVKDGKAVFKINNGKYYDRLGRFEIFYDALAGLPDDIRPHDIAAVSRWPVPCSTSMIEEPFRKTG